MEKKTKAIILILAILVVLGIATHFFLTPSSVESSDSQNMTDMINRTVNVSPDV